MESFFTNGIKVVPTSMLSDFRSERRSWSERLFTLPWTPWISTKNVYEPKVFLIGNSIICSNEVANKIRKLI